MSRELRQYAALLWRPEDIIEIRTFPPRGGEGFPEQKWIVASEILTLHPWMVERNQSKSGIYAGILPRVRLGGGKDEDVLTGKTVWADLDHVEPRDGWRRAKALKLPDPSVVVGSGHGVHLLWTFRNLIPAFRIRDTVGKIAELLGSDPSVKNPSRVLRLPGFQNWKDPPAMAKLLFTGEVLQDFQSFSEAVPSETPKPEAKTTSPLSSDEGKIERARKYVAMMPGKTTSGRTNQAFHVAGVLCRDYGLSHDEALPILQGWDSAANKPPIQGDATYPADELSSIIKNAMRYGKKPRGCKAESNYPDDESENRIDSTPPTESVLAEMLRELDDQESGKNNTIPLPWPVLHRETKMLRPGTVFLIAGPMKTGKTFFTLNILLHAAELGVSWRYIVLEDTATALAWRILAHAENNYHMIDDDQEGVATRREALITHNQYLAAILDRITDNPRIGKKDSEGNIIIPKVPMNTVLTWVKEGLQDAQMVIVDPVSLIEFDYRNQVQQEGDFMRACLAYAAGTKGIVGLIMHTVKRPGIHGSFQLTAEDIQGSAMFGRLAQTSILLSAHDMQDTAVRRSGGIQQIVSHNRTVIIGGTRNAPGARKSIAFSQGFAGPTFEELGIIVPKQKGKSK